MTVLRGILFDNLGLKLVALLLAVLVYLNVYTDRPASMVVSFPIVVTDLPESLAVVGLTPQAVAAELRGTGKQLIRLRVSEPPLKVSLAGVDAGRFERALGPEDLPLPAGAQIQVDRMVSPRMLSLTIDHRIRRQVPVAPRANGTPAAGMVAGAGSAYPPVADVLGPRSVVETLDSLLLEPLALSGRRDTVHGVAGVRLPEGSTVTPSRFEVVIPLEPEAVRRVTVAIESPRSAAGYAVTPDQVTIVVSGSHQAVAATDLEAQRAHWTAAQPLHAFVGRRVPVRREGALPVGVHVRLEPDSVTLRHTTTP